MREMTRSLLLMFLAITAPTVAHAHGVAPIPLSIVPVPGTGDFVATTSFGLLIPTGTPGASTWICEEALLLANLNVSSVARTPTGSFFVASGASLIASHDSGCTFADVEPFNTTGATDVQVHPGEPKTVFVTTPSFSGKASVRVSTDSGKTFPTTLPLPETPYSFTTVRVAPSRAQRLYVGGTDTALRTGALFVSDNAGATFATVPVTSPGLASCRVIAVSPKDPELVFLHVVDGDGNALLRSDDGGKTRSVVLAVATPVRDAAVLPDGTTVIAATTVTAHRSLDGGKTFTALATPLKTGCARVIGDKLAVCANEGLDGFAFGATADAAANSPVFTPLISFAQITGPLTCPAGTPVATSCTPIWPQVQVALKAILGGGDTASSTAEAPDTGNAVEVTADAGTGKAPEPTPSGCQSGAPSAVHSAVALLLLCLYRLGLGPTSRSDLRSSSVKRMPKPKK